MKSLFLCLCLLALPVMADDSRPAFLQFKQVDQQTFEMLWKVPSVGSDTRSRMAVQLPADIEIIEPRRSSHIRGAILETARLRRSGGLAGAEIRIEGIGTAANDVLLRIERLDGSSQVARLLASSPSYLVTAAPTLQAIVATYLLFGTQHILQSLDHLLFVMCLVLVARSWRRILITITGFTLAHSLTLSLAVLGLAQLALPPLELAIALSIVFLAREIAAARRDTLTWQYPLIVSSLFGLLHGFGFASALHAIGLPATEIPLALLAFNLGVELGQVLFVCGVVALVWLVNIAIRRIQFYSRGSFRQLDWLTRVEKPLAYAVGAMAVMWMFQRASAFWA